MVTNNPNQHQPDGDGLRNFVQPPVSDLHRQSASMFFCWPTNAIDLCKEDKDLPVAIDKLAAFIAVWEAKGMGKLNARPTRDGAEGAGEDYGDMPSAYLAAKSAPPKPAPDAVRLPEFEDPRVQIVYGMLCDDDLNKPPNPEEHWEGWIARNIVAALAAPVPSPDGAGETIPLADHDEIGRRVLSLPWDVQSAIVTIMAHCRVLKDHHETGPVADLAGCISQGCLELANALSPLPAVAAESDKVLRLLQASSCFRAEVCTSLPCACAESLSLSVQSARPDRDTLYTILSKHIPQDMIDGIWQEVQEAVQPGAGEREASLLDLADWCNVERSNIGAIDGYDYRSGEEFGLRRVEIEINKRLSSRQAPHSSGGR